MTTNTKILRTHKLAANAVLCQSGTYNPISPRSPAIEAMTDFLRTSAVSIDAHASLPSANAMMISRGVRLLLVTNDVNQIEGLITARDTLGEKPMQIIQARGGNHQEIQVKELMTPIGNIETLTLTEVMNARVSDILETLKHQGRQHILVEDSEPFTQATRVRGLFSATQIGRLLGIPVQGFELARTFAEIEATLAN